MLFFTHLRIGSERIVDDAGQEFPSLHDAKAEACLSAREIMISWLQQGQHIPPDFLIEIYDQKGRILELISTDMLVGRILRDHARIVFDNVHHPYLLLAPDFTIIEANSAFLRATITDLALISRRHVFDVFPDNPNDPDADGVRNLSASLCTVLTTKRPNFMAPQRYDIRRSDGRWEERHWKLVNLPVLDVNGEVEFIINHAEDITRQRPLREATLTR